MNHINITGIEYIPEPLSFVFCIRAALYNATVIIDDMHQLNKDDDEMMDAYIEGINTLNEAERELDKLKDSMKVVYTTITQAIADIRKYSDRMSIDGRSIQHIADSLEKLIK